VPTLLNGRSVATHVSTESRKIVEGPGMGKKESLNQFALAMRCVDRGRILGGEEEKKPLSYLPHGGEELMSGGGGLLIFQLELTAKVDI